MRLLFVDGNNVAMRCVFANNGLFDSKGRAIGAVFGSLRTLFKIAGEVRPDRTFWFWDGARSSFRKELYPEYKNRPRSIRPWQLDTFNDQVQMLKEYLPTLGVVQVRQDDQEADDLIYYLAEYFQEDEIVIASSDRDFYQLLSETRKIYGLAENKIFDLPKFQSKYGIEPRAWPMVRAISGDNSDNIKGVPGFGDVRSLDLVKQIRSKDREGFKEAMWRLPGVLHEALKSSLDVIDRNLRLIDLSCFPAHLINAEKLEAQIEEGLALEFRKDAFWKICEEHEFTTLLAENFEWRHVYGA